MRKNFMLSLAAMAALPMAGLADATVSLEGTTWKQGDKEVEFKSDGSYTSEQGVAISLTMNLVPGTYTFKLKTDASTSDNVQVTAKVDQKDEAKFKLNDTHKFTILDKEIEVTFVVSATNGGTFITKGIDVQLQYDFTKAKKLLSDKLGEAYGALTSIEGVPNPWAEKLTAEYNRLTTVLEAAKDGNATDAYDFYKTQKLWKGMEQSDIYNDITTLGSNALKCNANLTAYKYAQDCINELNEKQLAKIDGLLNAAVTATKTFYAEDVEALKTAIQKYQTTLDKSYDDHTAAEYFKTVDVDNWKAANEAVATDLQKRILAYDALYIAYDKATNGYYSTPGVITSWVNGYENYKSGIKAEPLDPTLPLRYENEYDKMLEAAKAELATAYAPIAEVLDFINNKESDIVAKKKEKLDAIDAASLDVKTVFNKYMSTTAPKGRLTIYIETDKDIADYAKRLAKVETATNAYYSDINKDNLLKDKIKDVTDKLSVVDTDLKGGINANKNLNDVTEYDAHLNDFKTAIIALESAANAVVKNYAAWQNLQTYFTNLSATLETANNAVKDLTSSDGKYKVSERWDLYGTIGDRIADFKALAEDAYKNVTAEAFFTNLTTVSTSTEYVEGQAIYTAISDYQPAAQNAFDWYENGVKTAMTWSDKLTSICQYATNDAVVRVADGKTYGVLKTEIQTAIDLLENRLNIALGAINDDLKDLTKFTVEPTGLTITEPEYVNDVKYYEQHAQMYAAQALVKQVQNGIKIAEAHLKALKDEFEYYYTADAIYTTVAAKTKLLGKKFKECAKAIGVRKSVIAYDGNTYDIANGTIYGNNATDQHTILSIKSNKYVSNDETVNETTDADAVKDVKKDMTGYLADIAAIEKAIAAYDLKQIAENVVYSRKKYKDLTDKYPGIQAKIDVISEHTSAGFTFASLNKDPNREGEFDTVESNLNTDFGLLQTGMFNADQDADGSIIFDNWEGQLNTFEAQVDAAQDAAKASTDNYKAYLSQLSAVAEYFSIGDNEIYADGNAYINAKIAEIEAIADPVNAGQNFFVGQVEDYRAAVNQLLAAIDNAYTDAGGRKSAEDNNVYQGAIKEYGEFINGQLAKAQTNETTHNALLAKQVVVEDFWREVNGLLEAADQTQEVQEWHGELATMWTNITTTTSQIATDFPLGGCTDATLYDAYYNRLLEIKTSLTGDTYIAELMKENNKRYNNFCTAYDKALATFEAAVKSLAQFRNIKDPELEVVFTDEVIAANEQIYTWNTEMLAMKAQADQAKTDADAALRNNNPKAFDLDLGYYNAAVNYNTWISDKYNDTTDKLNTTATALLTEALNAAKAVLDPSNSQINDYCEQLRAGGTTFTVRLNYTDPNYKPLDALDTEFYAYWDNAFKSQKQTVNTAEGKLAVGGVNFDRELAVTLANGFLAEVRGVAAAVEEARETLAWNLYDVTKRKLAQNYERDTQFIAANKAPEGDTTNYLETYKQAYADHITAAETGFIALGEAYKGDNYANGLALAIDQMKQFNDNNKLQDFKNQVVNRAKSEVAYDELCVAENGFYVVVKGLINDAVAYDNTYVATNPEIAKAQANLKTIYDQICADLTAGTLWTNKSGYEYNLNAFKDQIIDPATGLKRASDLYECNELSRQIQKAREDYAKAKAASTEDISSYETRIDSYETNWNAISDAYDNNQEVHDALIALEKALATTRYELTNIYDAALIGNVYAEVKGMVGKIVDSCTATQTDLTENCHVYVQNLYNEQVAAHLADAQKLGEEADARLNDEAKTFLLYSESLKATLKVLGEKLEQTISDIATAEEPWDTHDAVVNSLQEELDGYSARFQTIDAKLKGYELSGYADFDATSFNDAVANDQEQLDAYKAVTEPSGLISAGSLAQFSAVVDRIPTSTYAAYLDMVDAYYSHEQARNLILDLTTRLDEAYALAVAPGYHIIPGYDVDGAYSELYAKFKAGSHLRVYNNKTYAGIALKDIDGNPYLDEAGIPTAKNFAKAVYASECFEEVYNRVMAYRDEIKAYSEDIKANRYMSGNVAGNDEEVLVDDYTAILYHVLGKNQFEAGSKEWYAADITGDGIVNIGDIIAVARMINGTYAGSSSRALRAAAQTSDFLSVVCEGEGVHQRIGILLNANQAYAGAQLDITLPEGVTLVNESTGFAADGFSLNSNDLDNGVHRIVLSSLSGCTFSTEGEAILWLDVDVDHNYNGQEIEISNIYFSDANGGVFSLTAKYADTTGLSNVSMTEEVKDKIYNVGGILMDGLKRGVNIIRGNDGSSKKVIIK